MAARPLPLRDPLARDPALVGYKAALLGAAASAGLPVLPGLVLPLEASAGSIAAGAAVLGTAGRAAAYLASARNEPTAPALDALATVGRSVVVRSSTLHDDDGRWSGAFASYLDVAPGELAAAVRGCWSSAFAKDPVERCDAAGIEPADLRIAVLVQPCIPFVLGGTARTEGPDDGEQRVSVTVARGGPHGVVAGDAASTLVVAADGYVDGSGDAPSEVVRAVAALARRAGEVTGRGSIEWGASPDGPVLLQLGPTADGAVDRVPPRSVPAPVPAGMGSVAAVVARFRGALADELVLPWALGGGGIPDVAPAPVTDPIGAIAEARRCADRLTAAAWGEPVEEAFRRAASMLRAFRAGALESGLAAVCRLRVPAPAEAARLLGLIGGVGVALESRGVLRAPELIWRLSEQELDAALRGSRPSLAGGPDRWEAFLAEVALARGVTVEGTPITGAVGAGRLHVLTGLHGIGRPGPRSVIAARAPFPQLAPLLWQCAGLVTRGGSPGAHLFEVARSLGVPAVVGVGADEIGPAGSLVGVDGIHGTVASLPVGVDRGARRPA